MAALKRSTGNTLSAVSMKLYDCWQQCPAGLRLNQKCNFIILQCVILTAECCHHGEANWICCFSEREPSLLWLLSAWWWQYHASSGEEKPPSLQISYDWWICHPHITPQSPQVYELKAWLVATGKPHFENLSVCVDVIILLWLIPAVLKVTQWTVEALLILKLFKKSWHQIGLTTEL